MRPVRREPEVGKAPEEVAERRETGGSPEWLDGTAEMERRESLGRREGGERKDQLGVTVSPGSRGLEESQDCRAMLAGRERKETRACLAVME